MKIRQCYLILVCGLCLFLGSASATAIEDPVSFLEKLSLQVMGNLKDNKEEIQKNGSKIYEIVNKDIVPYVDFEEMSRWVAGRAAWAKSSKAEQASFVHEFKRLVVKTYATALVGFADEQVVFPAQNADTSRKRLEIVSYVKRRGDTISIKYRLLKTANSWKVYDAEVEGVSILRGFMAQFSSDVRLNGLTAVTRRIKLHNEK